MTSYFYKNLMASTILFIGAITPLLAFLLAVRRGIFIVDSSRLPFILIPMILFLLLAVFYITQKPGRIFYNLLVVYFTSLGIFFPALNLLFLYKNVPNEILLTFSVLSLLGDGIVVLSFLIGRFKRASIVIYAFLHTILFSLIILALTVMTLISG